MNNRTRFQWWLLRVEFRKYSSITAYGKNIPIAFPSDMNLTDFLFVWLFPTHCLFCCSGRCRQFSYCNSFSDLDLLFPLYLCQLKHTSGCAYDIFSEIHCLRDGDCLPYCFSFVFCPHCFTFMPFLFYEACVFDNFWKDISYIWAIIVGNYIKGESSRSLTWNDLF